MAEGLLGRIGSALKSPTAQGLLMAGATGFNPLLGLLAAPAIASGREREELRNEEARAAIRSRQQENEARQRQMTAQRQIPGLLRSAPPQLLDPSGDGLLAQPGAERTFQNRQMGILGNLSPDAAGEMMVTQMQGEQGPGGRIGDILKSLKQRGVEPTRENIAAEAQAFSGGAQGPDIRDLLSAAQLRQLLREEEAQADAAAEGEQLQVESVGDTIGSIGELSEKLDLLETLNEGNLPGAPFAAPVSGFNEFRRFLANTPLGQPNPNLEAAVAASGRLRSIIGQLTVPEAGRRLKEFDAITDVKFNAARESLLNPDATPAELRLGAADLLEANIRVAEKTREFSPEQLDAARAQLEQLRERGRIAPQTLEGRGASDLGGNQVDFMATLAGLGERAGNAGRGLLGEGQQALNSAADIAQAVVSQGSERVETTGASAIQALESGTREQRAAAADLLEGVMPHWEAFKALSEEEKQQFRQRIERARSGR